MVICINFSLCLHIYIPTKKKWSNFSIVFYNLPNEILNHKILFHKKTILILFPIYILLKKFFQMNRDLSKGWVQTKRISSSPSREVRYIFLFSLEEVLTSTACLATRLKTTLRGREPHYWIDKPRLNHHGPRLLYKW